MSLTYYSPYGYASSKYFSSPDETIQSSYFVSAYGSGSYTRPNLTEYLCFSTRTRDEHEFHGIGFLGGTGFPITYKATDTELTSRLSNRDYDSLAKKNAAGTAAAHFLSSSAFVTQDKSLVLVSSSDKPEAYLYSPSSKTTINHEIEFLSLSSPLKTQGIASVTGEDCYVIYDNSNNVSFVYRREVAGESSSSMSSSEMMDFSTSSQSGSSKSISELSSVSAESVVSSDFVMACDLWNRRAISGVSDPSFLGDIVLNGITEATSDSGDLYVCVYTNFNNMAPSEFHVILLKSAIIHPLTQENIVAFGTSFVPGSLPYICPVTPALRASGKPLSSIYGYIEFLGGTALLKNTISMVKISCVDNPLRSSSG